MRDNRRKFVVCAALVLASLALQGCAGSRSYAYRAYQGNEAAAALPAPGVYGFAGRLDLTGSRWTGSEVSRRNRSLSVRTPLPYSALGQWPGRVPPQERAVRFERYRQ